MSDEALSKSRSSHDDLASTTPHPASLSESGNSGITFQPVNVVDIALPSPDITTAFSESEKYLPAEMSSDACSVIGELFYPIAPTEFERSNRPDEVEDKRIRYDIHRLTVSFARRETPQPWTSYIHPEGARYFRCEHDLFTVYTDAYLFDPEILRAVQEFVDQVDEYLTRHGTMEVSFGTEKVDLVLDVTLSETNKTICGYYFAYHTNRVVFWLDEFESSERLWSKTNGVTSPDHILHEIQSQYWYGPHHCALFSSPRCVSQAVVEELRDIILHAIGDSIVSSTSTVSYTIEELRGILQLLPVKSGETGPGVSRIAYILMKHFAHERFLHFYGEPAARLNRGTSIYDKSKVHKRSFLFRILKYLLFAAPCTHLREIESMMSDGLLSQVAWRDFIDRNCKDWSHLTLYSTVLINVDVAFSSIQSVDTSPTSSPLKIVIHLSMLSSLGSLFFALLLLRRNNTRPNISADEAVKIMNSYQDSSCRYDNIAIIYSLPYALLIWGILFFITAFGIMCLWDTTPVTLVISSMAWAALGSLVIFYRWVSSTGARWQWLLSIRTFLCIK
ncbi:hypothetical protein IW261DRAFT_1564961 [Armillaria novae-zelandiae]|uniref:WW domain-containing protein n=1 Tax=Armillaria novae-zelandiae TaxID=153914 RepID=A0AA39TBW4_9AGAR|nr:hypothetical protein IW261DRAFT_1564961 [Armillaria novae-zelandiae]